MSTTLPGPVRTGWGAERSRSADGASIASPDPQQRVVRQADETSGSHIGRDQLAQGSGDRWPDRNDFDLHEQIVFDQARYLHGGTGWSRGAEVLTPHSVDGFTVGDIPVEDGDLANVGEARTGRLETTPYLLESESGLRRGVVSSDSVAMLVLSGEALDEDQITCSDSVRSDADWLRRPGHSNLLTKWLRHH
jgi:hypothetical protein